MGDAINALLMAAVMSAVISTVFADESTVKTSRQYMASAGADGVQRIAITGGEFFYKPDSIIVKNN